MPDLDDVKEGKKYHTDIPQTTEGFFLKGSNSLEWGMKNRLARIFNPHSGRTVMLATASPSTAATHWRSSRRYL